MARSSHELLIPDQDFGFDSISEVEEPLDEALMAARVGEVTGGGIGSGWYRIEMDLPQVDLALPVIVLLARRLELPNSTLFRRLGEPNALPPDRALARFQSQESGG